MSLRWDEGVFWTAWAVAMVCGTLGPQWLGVGGLIVASWCAGYGTGRGQR